MYKINIVSKEDVRFNKVGIQCILYIFVSNNKKEGKMLRIFKDAKMYLKMKNEVPNNLNLLSTLVWSSNRWTFFYCTLYIVVQ